MRFPTLRQPEVFRESVDVFLGYNRGGRIGDGEFADMENLSSDGFPLLTPRQPRKIYGRFQNCTGLTAKDSLCYVDGSRFVMNGFPVELGLTDSPKQLVSMGAYVVIFPDKKYINTANLADFGNLDAVFTTVGEVTYTPSALDGTPLTADYIQTQEPEDPENMALWLDPSARVLRRWYAGSGMWSELGQSYVKITAPGIGMAFRTYDGVTLSGGPEEVMGANVLWGREEDWILVPGLLEREVTSLDALTVERRMPEVDFVVECDNRLWGCRYGLTREGEPVNELYASRQGDFRNWNCFMGLASDSYRVSLGADGPFTGAVTHLGYPLFFRENCLHKVYGNLPANFRVQTTVCRGVQSGSSESLTIVGEVLYYLSQSGVCAYDGALPVSISQALGKEHFSHGVGGCLGSKYYLSMKNARGEYRMFVYDSLRKLWHVEDGMEVRCFCTCREELFFLDAEGVIRSVTGGTEAVRWFAESGPLGAVTPDSKYLSRLNLRLWLEMGTKIQIQVQYDSGPQWETVGTLRGDGLRAFSLPLRVRRCDHLRLRLAGEGDMKLYGLVKTMELGSDVP